MTGHRTAIRIVIGMLSVSCLLTAGLFIGRTTASPDASAPTGKITPWQAMKLATAKTPGRAIEAIFEYEGKKWQYGVVVVSGKTLHEVEIDAVTGKVGDSEVITPEGESKEVKAELSAAIGKKPAGKKAGEKEEKED